MKWTPRDTAQQLQRLTRHTSFVVFSKYGLTILAAALIITVFLVPLLHDGESGARLVFTNVESGDFIKPRMSNPRLQGLDKSDQPYTVTARIAEQQEDGKVLLSGIQADITLNNGSWLAFMGNTGMLDTEKNTLLLPEDVQVFHDAGYDMRTRHVFIDLDTAEVSGDQRIDGQGPLGTLSASGFRVDSNAGHIRFTPQVTVTLYPRSQP
jgi:lipopolysaccharide export system protein LptC